MSVIGQEYKQPRVFAHDAWPVVTGAINYTWNTNSKSTPITLSAGSGSVPGVLTVEAVDADGLITDWSFDPTTVSNLGAGYAVGDNLTQAGTSSAAGTGFTCTVTNIDIPNTQEAGCCLYIGRSGGFTSLLVIMEAGAYDRSAGDGYPAGDVVTLGSVSSGSILPISVKQITTVLALNNVIALY